MRTQIFVHQSNKLSFSYSRSKMTKRNFENYMESKTLEDNQQIIQQHPYNHLHIVKDGIYQLDVLDNVHTYCSIKDLHRCYYLSDDLYFFILKHLKMNLFSIDCGIKCLPTQINHISSTFYPEDILEVNTQDFYKIYIRNRYEPLYLQTDVKVYDETGNRRNLMDILHQLGRRRVMGVNSKHHFEVFEIEKVQNVSPDDEISILDTPFYSIGIVREEKQSHPVLVNQILVDLN